MDTVTASPAPLAMLPAVREPETGPVVRVRFGPGPCQDLPLNLAEAILYILWQKSPAQFGTMLRQAMINTWARHGEDES